MKAEGIVDAILKRWEHDLADWDLNWSSARHEARRLAVDEVAGLLAAETGKLAAVDPTWECRELPVLKEIVAFLDPYTGQHPEGSDIATGTGLDIEQVGSALIALDGAYIDLRRAAGGFDGWWVESVTPLARQAVGQWPSPEALVDKIAAGIAEAADQEPDEARKGGLRAVRRGLAGAGRDIAINVVSAYLGQIR